MNYISYAHPICDILGFPIKSKCFPVISPMYAQLQRTSGEMSCQSLFVTWNLWEHTRARLSATLQTRTRATKKSPTGCCIRETAWQKVKKQPCTHWKLSCTTTPCQQPKNHLRRRLFLVAVQTPSFDSFILRIEERSLFRILVLFPDSLLLSFSTLYSGPVYFYCKETTLVEDFQRVSSTRQSHSDTLIH